MSDISKQLEELKKNLTCPHCKAKDCREKINSWVCTKCGKCWSKQGRVIK